MPVRAGELETVMATWVKPLLAVESGLENITAWRQQAPVRGKLRSAWRSASGQRLLRVDHI
jgi:hypothetical protein